MSTHLSEALASVLNNLKTGAMFTRLAGSLPSASDNGPVRNTVFGQHEQHQLVNAQLWIDARGEKQELYVIQQRQLYFSIVLSGTLLFSCVLMYFLLVYPDYAWILCCVVSLAIILGVLLSAFTVDEDSIVGSDGWTLREKSTKDPLDATLEITMPFLIFSAALTVVAAGAVVCIWAVRRTPV